MALRGYLKKDIAGGVLDVDTTKRSVKVAISQMESEDRDRDIITKTAFNRTIKAKGPKGTNEIWHLTDHRADFHHALGKFTDLYVEGNYLIGISQYKDSALWRDVMWPLYEAGDVNQHSIGFSTVNSNMQTINGKEVRIITEVELWEGSAVPWGANPDTPTLGITKAQQPYYEAAKSMGVYADSMSFEERIEKMQKALKSDSIDSDMKELFRIELMQIHQIFSDLQKATAPAPATPPEEEEKPSYDKSHKIDWNVVALAFSI